MNLPYQKNISIVIPNNIAHFHFKHKKSRDMSKMIIENVYDSMDEQIIPYYHKQNSILIHDDSFVFLDKMKSESVDMIFADPPYFLSNGGFSNSGGQVVSVNKGE